MADLFFALLKLAFHAGEAVAAAELKKKQAAPPPKKRATPGKLLVTDEMRSMIASALVGCNIRRRATHRENDERGPNHSLCCADDKIEACAAIVGWEHAESLSSFFYESLSCSYTSDLRSPEDNEREEQYYLDKIANLEEL